MRSLSLVQAGAALIAAGVPAGVIAVGVIRAYRYAVWAGVGRDLAEGLALVLPVVAVVSAVVAVTALRPGLLWYAAGLPRSRVQLVSTACWVAGLSTLGWLTGSAPLLIWGLRTATYGGPPLLIIVAGAAGVFGISLLAQALTTGLGTWWAGPGLVALLVACFYLGRFEDVSFQIPTAPLAFLPFDGVNDSFSGDQRTPIGLTVTRFAGAVVVTAFATFVLARSAGARTRSERFRAGLITPVTVLVLAAAAGAGAARVPVATQVTLPVSCASTQGPRVCVLATHGRDLDRIRAMVDRLYRATGPALLPARLVSESVPNGRSDEARIVVPDDRATSFADSLGSQLGTEVVRFERCLDGRASQDSVAVADLIGLWFAWQAGAEPSPAAQTSELRRWARSPDRANARFRALADQIQHCRVRRAELP